MAYGMVGRGGEECGAAVLCDSVYRYMEDGGSVGTRRFPGGQCLVSGSFNWRQRQGAYSGNARHEHERRGALSHTAGSVVK
jgi:hypothetical protein